jgi:hypothetical protein
VVHVPAERLFDAQGHFRRQRGLAVQKPSPAAPLGVPVFMDPGIGGRASGPERGFTTLPKFEPNSSEDRRSVLRDGMNQKHEEGCRDERKGCCIWRRGA